MSRPLLDQTLFLDRDLGAHDVSSALKAAGIKCEIHRDHFRHDELDQIWVPIIAKNGWPILTKDNHMRTRQVERIAIQTSGAMVFVLRSNTGLTGHQMGAVFMQAYERICRAVRNYVPPFIAKVTASGSVEMRDTAVRRGGVKKQTPQDSENDCPG